MKFFLFITFIIITFCNCTLSLQGSRFTNSSIQKVDMGEFNGLRIIEIASLNYPEVTAQTQTGHMYTDIDKDNFNSSLIQSLKRSDVRVLPSAQTKIHINFTQLAMLKDTKDTIIKMTAELAVSRNGIITRKTIEINGKAKFTIGATKDNGVKLFIQELGELLREQSSFKR